MQRSNSSSILGIVCSGSARRVGLAILAAALLLCAGSLMGGRRAFPGGFAGQPQATGAQTAAPTVPTMVSPEFQPPRALPIAAYDGLTATAQLMTSGAVRPLSLATDDFNEDGWPDLAAGFATNSGDGVAVLYFGDRDAYAPETPQTLAGIRQNRFPIPFLSEARAFALPEAPDFLATGDFSKTGNPGLLVGARGSEQLYVLPGNGHGKLGAPLSISLPGKLTALATGQIGRGDTSPDVAVAVTGINGPELLIYKAAFGGVFATPIVYALSGEVTSLKIGSLDDDPYGDVAILAGGSLYILHGQLWGPGAASGTPLSPAPELESVPLSSSARAIAVGDFIWERNNRLEIAVLTGSAVQILSRGTPVKRPVPVAQIRTARMAMAQLRLSQMRAGTPPPVAPAWQPGQTLPWQVVKNISVPAAGSAFDLEAVTTAMPNRAPQSVLVAGASSQLHLLTEPPGPTNANPTFGSGNSTTSAGSAGSAEGAAPPIAASWSDDAVAIGGAPVAVLPMRVDVSAQPGLVTLNQGQVAPMLMIGPKGPSITVNRTDDSASASACAGGTNDCSLRGAIIYANAHSATTISVPPGTYTLTIGENDDPNADPTAGDLDINAGMTIVGAGAGSTIIQANFPVVDGQDGKIFGVNQDGSHDGIQVSISGVTLEGARNSVGQNDIYFTDTGGAVDFFLTGTSTSYSLSNCTIQNNTNVHSYGGGINVDSGADSNGNFGGQNHGTVTISNCSIIGNTTQGVEGSSSSGTGCPGTTCNTADATGGGVNLLADIHNAVITNSTISNNQTGISQSGSYPNEGGGFYIEHTNGGSVSIHATAIGDSVNGGNQSASRGGGIDSVIGKQALTIDQGSRLVNNVSGARNVGTDVAEGGGIYIADSGSTSLTQVTITGNSLSTNSPRHGGGGIAVGEVTSTVTVSYCRIAGNSASGSTGTGLHKDNESGTVSATDNWWGCNGGPSASPCDTAVLDSGGSGTLSFNPWLELSLAPSTAQSVENNGTLVFTADLNHDSNGSATASHIPDGTPINFGTTGGIGSDSPLNTTTSSGTASSTFTASTVGSGTVTTTVDSQTDSTNVTVYVPVTIASSPTGESFTVTGAAGCSAGSYTAPQTLNWSAASCTVQFTSPVPNGTGARLAFSQWADGNTNNPRTITTPASPTTFTANYVQQYQLTTAVAPAGAGTVTTPASGTYLNSGTAVTLSASANAGYTFSNWSVTSGSATIGNANAASTTVTLSSGPATVQANFAVQVTIASSPTGESFTVTGGTACAAGSYTAPQTLNWSAASCTVQFTSPVPDGTGAQLAFSQWADGNTSNPRTITTPASPTTFTANFVQQYQLTTAVAPAGAGTVTTPASGTYLNSGATVALSASANAGYTFNNWSVTSGSATIGNANAASTTVTLSSGPATVQANFAVQVTIASSPTGESFSVSGAAGCATGSYTTPKTLSWSAASCTVQFTSPVPDGTGAQLAFSQWADGNTNNPRTITTPASPTTFTANFVQQYQLTTAVSPAGAGTVNTPASGTYLNSGTAVTLSASANAGYTFSNWSVTSGSATIGNANSASTTVTLSSGPATVQANFSLSVVNVTIASKLDGSARTGLSFSVSGTGCQAGNYSTQQVLAWVPGSTCTVTFNTPQGPGGGTQYVFTEWDDTGSPSNSRVFSVPSGPTTYAGDFTTQYLLTTAVNPAGAGSATPSTPTYYNINSTPAIQATANSGYTFTNWSSTGGAVTSPNSASTTVTMSAPTTVTANFGELKTSLSGLITAKVGAQNGRVWTITLSNTGPGAANAAQINNLSLTETGGAACTPVITSTFPVAVGNIAPASTGSGTVTIDFTGCANNARFTTIFTFSANAGTVTGSRTLYNQFQ